MDRYRMLPSYRFYDVEGTPSLTLDKSVGKSLRDYKIYGNSVQEGTPTPENPIEIQSCGDKSKNLVDMSKVINGYLNQTGAIITPNQEYRVTDFIDVSNMSHITINAAKSYAFYDENKTFISGEVKSLTIFRSYAVPANAKYIRFDWQTEKVNGDIVYAFAGSYTEDTFPPYEPYGYKIPIEVGGKNLFDIDAFLALPNASKYYKKDEDNNLVQVIQDFRQYKVVPVYMELPPGTYTVSLTGATNDLWLVCVNDVVVTDTFTLTETSPVKIKSFYQAGTVVGKFQLEKGGTATPYEPYRKEVTNIYLDEPLYKIGGSADYIDFKNGKVVRKNKKIALQINKDMVHYRDRGSVVTYRTDSSISLYLDNYKKSDTYNIPNMCNKFKFMSGASLTHATDEHGEWLACAYGTVYVTIRKDRLSEVTNSSVTEYVNNLNAELIYALDVPIEQPIDLPPILTHKGTNIISVGAEIPPSNMQIQYYK